MARPKLFATDERVRLNLEIARATHEQLLRLQKISGSPSLSDMARRSFALFDLALEHVEKGGKIIFKHADGTEEVLMLKVL